MQNPDIIQDVADFMLAMGQCRQILYTPTIPEEAIQLLRSKLNREEFSELDLAWCRCRELKQAMAHTIEHPKSYDNVLAQQARITEGMVEALADLADGIGDLIYVLVGQANAYGIPLAAVWREIQRANMGKLWTVEEAKLRNSTDICEVTPIYDQARSPHRLWSVRSADGKVRKPPSFTPPNIKQIIIDAINNHKRNPHPGETGFVPASESPHEKTIAP